MGPDDGGVDDDLDILPQILRPGESILIEGTAPSAWANKDTWTLYITDTDGDTSFFYEYFNPWIVKSVAIGLVNTDNPYGYVCIFTY